MHVRCPHCHNPIEVVADAALTDLNCPSCGSRFSLISGETTGPVELGTKTLGRFELLQEVGTGAFGSVWKARDSQLDRIVAVKIPRQAQLGAAESELFFREARAAAQVRHPNIVPVHEIGREHGTVYIVSDFVDGANLKQWLSAQRLTPREAAQLCIKIAEALHEAHERGIVHRDLKPGNIMLDAAGEPQITDFGLAKRDAGEITMTVEGRILGTPAYMSPEQARGQAHTADRRADIYSLGVILFELLTGELPFRGEERMLIVQILRDDPPRPRKLASRIPRDLETICLKCLEKDPRRRYATARDLADELSRFAAGDPIKARPVSRFEHAWRWSRRNPVVASLSAGVLALLASVALVSTWAYVRAASDALAKTKLVGEKSKLAEDMTRLAKTAETERRQAKRQAAFLELDRGLKLCETGSVREGLLWMARSLKSAPLDDAPLQHLIRANLGGWYRRQCPIQLVLEHQGDVTAVAFSSNGKVVLTGSEDKTARLWDAASGRLRIPPLEHDGAVLAVGFSPTDHLVATGSADGKARLWDAANGKLLHSSLQHEGPVQAIAFSADGRVLATGAGDGTAQIWEVATGQPLHERLSTPGSGVRTSITAVAFTSDGSLLLTAAGQIVSFWTVATGEPAGEPLVLASTIDALAISPDGEALLAGTRDFRAQLWNLRTRGFLTHFAHRSWVFGVAFSSDGRRIITASRDGTAQLWETATGRALGPPLPHQSAVRACAFSPGDDYVLTGCESGVAQLWEANLESRLGPLLQHHDDMVGTTYSSDSQSFLAIGESNTVNRQATTAPRVLGPRLTHTWGVTAAGLSPDGRTIVTSTDEPALHFWDAVKGVRVGDVLPLPEPVRDITFSHDGRTILAAGGTLDSGEVWHWDIATRKLLWTIHHRQSVLRVAFSPDDRLVLTASEDQTARIWETATGKPVAAPLRHQNAVWGVACTRDGKMIATADWNGTVQFWNPATGSRTGPLLKHDGIPVMSVAFSPDGQTLVTGTFGGSVRLWDVATGRQIGPVLSHAGKLHRSAFSPNGKTFLTSSEGRTTRLWQFPAAVQGESERIGLWIRLSTGMELDNDEAIRVLDGAEWLRSNLALASIGGAPGSPQLVFVDQSQVPADDAPIKVEKSKPVDLLRRIDVDRDRVAGDWQKLPSGSLALHNPGEFSRIQIPQSLPKEYRVTMEVTRIFGESLNMTLVASGQQFDAGIDGWGSDVTSLNFIDGNTTYLNETTRRGRVLLEGKRETLVYEVTEGRIRVRLGNQVLINWRGSPNRLSLPPVWALPNRDQLGIGMQKSNFEIHSIELQELGDP